MTWADDIAVYIHDTEGLFRAGLIPLDRLAADRDNERAKFLREVRQRWSDEGDRGDDLENWAALEDVFNKFCDRLNISEPYEGTRLQRLALRSLTSSQIGKYNIAQQNCKTASRIV